MIGILLSHDVIVVRVVVTGVDVVRHLQNKENYKNLLYEL